MGGDGLCDDGTWRLYVLLSIVMVVTARLVMTTQQTALDKITADTRLGLATTIVMMVHGGCILTALNLAAMLVIVMMTAVQKSTSRSVKMKGASIAAMRITGLNTHQTVVFHRIGFATRGKIVSMRSTKSVVTVLLVMNRLIWMEVAKSTFSILYKLYLVSFMMTLCSLQTPPDACSVI